MSHPGGEVAITSVAEASASLPQFPGATVIALTLLSLGVWGAIHSAASEEAKSVSPGGQRSTLPRGIVSGTKALATPSLPPASSHWTSAPLLGIVGVLFFVGMLGITGSAPVSPALQSRPPLTPD
jgi:hypothetical protein